MSLFGAIVIIIPKTYLFEMQRHGAEAYPLECCGGILGKIHFENKYVQKVIRLDNASSENKHRRFAVTAEDYKNLEAYSKESNLQLIGFYHTHPDHPAFPSETDLQNAWPMFSYIIISIQSKEPAQTNSFLLNLDTNTFEPEPLQTVEFHSDTYNEV